MRSQSLACALVILSALLADCDKSQNQSSPTQSGPPPLAEVRLGYFANVTHAQAVLGVASGEFQSALGQTKLTTKVFNAGPELITALNAGAIDIGYVGPGPVLSADVASRGQAVRVIAGAAANGVVIVASKNSGIHTLSDLKGKRIATPQLGNTQDVLSPALRHRNSRTAGRRQREGSSQQPAERPDGPRIHRRRLGARTLGGKAHQ